MPRTLIPLILLAFVLVPIAPAQGVSAVASPNPVPPGGSVTVTVTVTDPNGIMALLNPGGAPCIAGTFYTGGPNGTFMFCGGILSFCGPNTMFLPQCSTFTQTVTACSAPGDYWIRVSYKDATGANFIDEWLPIQVQGGTTATLTNLTTPTWGNVLDIMLTDTNTNAPTALYVGLASLTANAGNGSFPPLFLCVDPDFLFDLSFPVPDPFLFVNFQGFLDLSGQATMSVLIPNVPALGCLPVHFQAVIVPGLGTPYTSTCLSLTLQ